MTYKEILSEDFFFNTYSEIEYLKRNYPVNHGFVHVWHVIENAQKLAKMFNLSEKESEILLISATLHDIGYILGREDHAKNGSILACEFLQNKLPDNEIEMVCNAIASHGGKEQENYENRINLCLILADKFDFVGTRYREDNNQPSTKLYSCIKSVELVEVGNELEVKITSTLKTLEKELEVSSFYSKFKEVLKKAEKAINKKINLKFMYTNEV